MTTIGPTPASEQASQTQDILQKLSTVVDTDPACDQLLGQLYALTRSADGQKLASSLGRSDIGLLGHYSFDSARPESRRSALRCLNNVLVQAPSATKLFADAGLPQKAIKLLKSADADEFIAARLLLLCSVHAAADLLPHHGALAEAINTNIARHAETYSIEPTSVCIANLQLLSALAAKHEALAPHFFESLGPMFEMFDRAPIPSPPLDPFVSSLIDSLAVLLVHDEALVSSQRAWPPFTENKLVKILDLAIQAYQHRNLEPRIMPLTSLLLHIARPAPAEIRERLRACLLPSDRDRMQPLGWGDSLPHRLVRISTEAVTPGLKILLAHLLLDLSDGDPDRLVYNVGFGCAVGLLRSLGMPGPPGNFNTDQSTEDLSEINPVTGQRRDAETQSNLPEMTEEEKELEAERLFVLFERLRATGVVNVENPVSVAVRSGQIEELDSDTEDE